MSAANFRGLRREIAVVLRLPRKRTLYEASKALGRRPGDIQRTVRQMYSEGLLEASDPKPVRGTLFWFAEEYAEELDEALTEDRPPGQLSTEQRVLAIEAPNGVDPYRVLGRNDLNGLISWVAEWGGDGELLIGMAQGTALLAVEQLIGALRESDIVCVQRRMGEIMDGAGLRRLAIGKAESAEETIGA